MLKTRAQSWLHGARVAAAAMLGSTGSALAAGVGKPEPWQMTRQVAVTADAADLALFEGYLHVLAFAISVFVLGLILYCVFKFNEKANPTPSKTTHNTMIEVAWTIIPVLILVAVAIPSFRTLRTQLSDPAADVTIKAIGHTWNWTYEYPAAGEQKAFTVEAIYDESAGLEPRMLAMADDANMVVPVNKIIKVQVTSTDVIHSWAVPSFGGKIDAIPGRLNQWWFKAEREGIYYGQCSELCGLNHSAMPIAVKVVSEEEYAKWAGEHSKAASLGQAPKFADAKP